MLGLVSLFFHLGFHIGNFNRLASTNMYSYLIGHRYSRSIFNARFSILCIRKVTLFLLLSSKLNYTVLPVIYGFELRNSKSKSKSATTRFSFHSPRISNGKLLRDIVISKRIRKVLLSLRFLRRRKEVYWYSLKSRLSCFKRTLHSKYSLYCSRMPATCSQDYVKIRQYARHIKSRYSKYAKYVRNKYRYYIGRIEKKRLLYMRLLRQYNKRHQQKHITKLVSTNLKYLSQPATGNIVARLFNKFRFPVLLNTTGLITNWTTYYSTIQKILSEVVPTYRNNKVSNNFFVPKLDQYIESNFLRNCIKLVLCVYYKLHLNIELDIVSYKFKIDRLISEFKKFYVFIKFLIYLREFKRFPSILFYLDPSEPELATISKYRICTLSLVDSNLSTSNYATYPIPSSFGAYLSKIFYGYLFINSYFIGRILLIISSIV